MKHKHRITIWIVDDDEDDCFLMKTAFQESNIDHHLVCFENGQKMMDYLRRCDDEVDSLMARPDVILLDLNMPVKDGRVVLHEIKKDPTLCNIPVVVLTDSEEPIDAIQCYELGASLYYTKSQWMQTLVEIIKTSGEYWLDFAARVERIGSCSIDQQREMPGTRCTSSLYGDSDCRSQDYR